MQHTAEDCICEGKLCTKCNQIHCVNYFYLDKSRNRRRPSCNTCEKLRYKIWSENNKDKVNDRCQRWTGNNRERANARKKAWALTHPDKMKAAQERYRIAHPEHKHGNHSYKYTKTLEAIERYREKSREWKRKHPDIVKAYNMRNNHIRRARLTKVGGSFTAQEWEALKIQYDHRCLRCGRQEPEIKLTADHVIPIAKRGSNSIDNIQPLCQSCNSRKHAKIIDFRPSAQQGVL